MEKPDEKKVTGQADNEHPPREESSYETYGWEFVDVAADPDDPSVPEGEVVPGHFKPAHFF